MAYVTLTQTSMCFGNFHRETERDRQMYRDKKVLMTHYTWLPRKQGIIGRFICKDLPHFNVIFALENNVYFEVPHTTVEALTIRFKTSRKRFDNVLPLHEETPWSGYVTSPGYDGVTNIPEELNVTRTLHAPLAMTS
jgi:hypothetical protein